MTEEVEVCGYFSIPRGILALDKSNIIFKNIKLPIVSRLLGINVSGAKAKFVASDGNVAEEFDFQMKAADEMEERGSSVAIPIVQKQTRMNASSRATGIKKRSAQQVDDESMEPPAKPTRKPKSRKKKKKPVEEVEGWVERDLTGDQDDED